MAQVKRSKMEDAVVKILGRLYGIADDHLTTAEKQIKEIAVAALADKARAQIKSGQAAAKK